MNKTQIWAEAQSHMKVSKIKETSELYKRMAALLEPKSKQSQMDIYPPKLNEDGEILELWCTKHEQYELLAEFPENSKFKRLYDPNCRVALKQWRAYGKEITNLKDEQNVIKDSVLTGAYSIEDAKTEIAEIQANIDTLDAERKGAYAYPIIEEAEEA